MPNYPRRFCLEAAQGEVSVPKPRGFFPKERFSADASHFHSILNSVDLRSYGLPPFLLVAGHAATVAFLAVKLR